MNPEPAGQVAVLIPAYRPSTGLIDLVRTLSEGAPSVIVIVDDGSGPDYRDVFSAVAQFPGVQLLRHAVNLGKGAALKTGFNYAMCTYPNLAGVVTADADGQHHPKDIVRVGEALRQHPQSLVLGARTFRGDIPLRSRFGNILTRTIMHALLGQKLTDTQTGLRGIPASFLPRLMRIEATGYEFELEMLISAHEQTIPMLEVPIQTIYEEGNKSSHFNPIVDSMKIYFVLLRFGSVSVMSGFLDSLVFYLVSRTSASVLLSQVIGRTVSVCFNYSMVRSSVFSSHQRHKSVLPKYLALVLVSGTASYGGIRFLQGKFGVSLIPAKLMVETTLFFVNFAIQRLFIFKSQSTANRENRTAPVLIFSALIAVVFFALLGVELYGFRVSPLFNQEIWFRLGMQRFLKYIGAFLGLTIPLLLIVPWAYGGLIAALLLVLTTVSIGPLPVLATAFFLLAACALGSRLMGRSKYDSLTTDIIATLFGAGVYVFLMTLTARMPVQYPAVWGVLLAIPIAADLRGTRERLTYWVHLLRGLELRSLWERASLGLLVFVIIMHWLVALKPEASADGLAMHLAIPMNIATYHRMTFEPGLYLWSAMPMGTDWIYTIVYLLGGEYATHLINFTMLVLLAVLIYKTVRRWVPAEVAYLLAASFVATPVVQFVTGSLFVENFVALAVLGFLAAIWRFGETGQKRFLYAAMMIGGTAITAKYGAVLFVALGIPFLIAEIARHWKSLGRQAAAVVTLAFVLLLVTAAPTFVIAYAKTGNPIYPFQNQTIHSPLLDPTVSFNDARYRIPIDWSMLYTLTFQTNRSYEGQDGTFGFQYMILAPLAMLALLVATRRPAQSAAIVAIIAGALIMRSQPNVRYLYTAMPLLVIPIAALLHWMMSNQRWMYRTLIIYIVAATGFNIYFTPGSNYYHKEFCLRLPFSRAERDRYIAEGAPIRKVIEYFNAHHANTPVLLTSDSTIAGLNGDIYVNHWHQFPTAEQLRRASTLSAMQHLLDQWKVQYFITHVPSRDDQVQPLMLRILLNACTVPEYKVQDVYLARLEPDCEKRTPAMALGPGSHDDFDPSILFDANWVRDEHFREAESHTITYSAAKGAKVTFSFQGTALTYVYTKAFNRGTAAVSIDNVSQGTVDLYSPDIVWQSRQRFCCFKPGRHEVSITVTGESSPKATGKFIDLDSVIVE